MRVLRLFLHVKSFNMVESGQRRKKESQLAGLAPFMQRISIPMHSRVLGIGDLHGCAHSLLQCMNKWVALGDLNNDLTIARSDAYIALLGDYVDRGCYGIETLYTIMCLALANPDKVFVLRGNHEDVEMNRAGGFLCELIVKYGRCMAPELLADIAEVYDCLPQALFVISPGNPPWNGCVQLCHAGVEPRMNVPGFVLDSGPAKYAVIQIDRDRAYDATGIVPSEVLAHDLNTAYIDLMRTRGRDLMGLTWSDFFDGATARAEWARGGSYTYGHEIIDALRVAFARQSNGSVEFMGVLRGHQHAGDMFERLRAGSGMACFWHSDQRKGRVFTSVSLPSAGALSLPHDSFFVLTTGATPGDWHITHWYTESLKDRTWKSVRYTFGD